MKELKIIIAKDLHEILHTRAFFLMLAIAAFFIAIFSQSLVETINSLLEPTGGTADIAGIESVLGTLFFILTFLTMMMFSLYMNAYTVVLEKTKRTIESLLCTPVSLRQIWLGKTLASFLPSLGMGLVLSFGTLIVINIITISPHLGRWVMPGAAPLIGGVLIVPLVIFSLSSLVIILQLMLLNIRVIQTIFMALIFGSTFGLSYSFRFSSSSWYVVLAATGLAVVLGVVLTVLSGRLTKERIVLTSKG